MWYKSIIMETYYTSDWHLGHKNIIRYSNRPFTDVKQMNRAIIENTKARLKPGDRLFFLGDFGFQHLDQSIRDLREIKSTGCLMYLVPGNHDPEALATVTEWDSSDPKDPAPCIWEKVSPLMDVNDRKRHVVLCHYTIMNWNRAHHGSYHLFGHAHGNMPGTQQSMDVGVDPCGFQPLTLDECIERMAKFRPWKSADHHKKREDSYV